MKGEILALLIILCVSDINIQFTAASVQSANNHQIFTSHSRRLDGDEDGGDEADDDEDKKVVNPKPLPKKPAAPVKKTEDGEEDSEDGDKTEDENKPADEEEDEDEKAAKL